MSTGNSGYYGYLVGIVTATTLQPLDNIKMALIVPPAKLTLTNNFLKNIVVATRFIHRQEGWRSFYKGLVSNLWKTGISSSVFFYTLRTLEGAIQALQGAQTPEISMKEKFITSCLARVTSAIMSNPLSVLQARYQITGKQKWEGSIINSLKRIYEGEGIQGFFKGGLTTCVKEGSFAGLYYALYEKGKSYQIPSVIAGMTAGLISTFVTHPFEIIRTNIQVHSNFYGLEPNYKQASIASQLIQLGKKGELFKGVAPRLAKKPLANTFAFVLFEYLEDRNRSVEALP